METSMKVEMKVKKARALRRAASRGVTLVEVLIVLAIMALIAGSATFLVFPQLTKARVKTAKMDGMTIRKAAEVHINLDGNTGGCPSVQDLVGAKKLESGKTTDPWGKPYKLVCGDDDIRVISSGKDGKEGTPDDVPDNLPDKEIEKIAEM
jgi:general secretion pathway protein G